MSVDDQICLACQDVIPNCIKCIPNEFGIWKSGCLMCKPSFILNRDRSKCLKCSEIDSNCVECELNLNLTNLGNCKKCDDGFILSSNLLSCNKCPENCERCQPDGTCSLCKKSFGLNANRTECVRCPLSCGKCDIKKNSKDCKVCSNGYRLNQFLQCEQCLPKLNCLKCEESVAKCSECPQGSILENNQCSRCSDLYCSDCEVNDKTKCKSSGCVPGSFFKSSDATCVTCDSESNCLACDPNTPSECTDCFEGEYITYSKICEPYKNLENCDKCDPNGDYGSECKPGFCKRGLSSSSNKCSGEAETTCKTCNADALEICTACEKGQYISSETSQCKNCLDNSCENCDIKTGRCISDGNCKENYSLDTYSTNCVSCSTIQSCKSCHVVNYSVKKCKICDKGKYLDTKNNFVCKPCKDLNCEKCETDTGLCEIDGCKTGYTLNPTDRTCVVCAL